GESAQRDLGAFVLNGTCLPYGDPNTFGPIAEALRQASGLDPSASDDEHRTRIAEKVAHLLGPETDAAELARVIEGLDYLVEGTARPGVDPGRARDEAMRAALAVLDALALMKPV